MILNFQNFIPELGYHRNSMLNRYADLNRAIQMFLIRMIFRLRRKDFPNQFPREQFINSEPDSSVQRHLQKRLRYGPTIGFLIT
jgi:hypothetical protein